MWVSLLGVHYPTDFARRDRSHDHGHGRTNVRRTDVNGRGATRFTIRPDDYHVPYAGTAEDGRRFFLSEELFRRDRNTHEVDGHHGPNARSCR
jgi:hypothetical protein